MVSQVERLRGKERLQQLMEAFPEAERRQVLLVELDREGVKPNETTRWLGKWSLPDSPSYFERNKEGMYRSVEKSEMGYYFNPFVCCFGDGVNFRIAFDTRSPYEFRYEGNGRYQLYRDGEAIEEVFFPPRPQWYDKKTSSGKPMASIISIEGSEDGNKLAAMTYCEYFKDDKGCRYCNINPTETVNKEIGTVRQIAKQEQDVYETTLAVCQETKQKSFHISGGVILDPSKEADLYARLIRAQRRAEKDAGYERPIPYMVRPQAMEPEDTMKLKEAGGTTLGFNLEVWDPKLFEWLCPGKAKYVGRERWIERLLKAVEVFGEGCTFTSFILGVEMAPPHGFKSEDEGAASHLEGWEWMLAHRVIPQGAAWRPAPNTVFEGLPSPRTEYILRVRLAAAKLVQEYKKKLQGG